MKTKIYAALFALLLASLFGGDGRVLSVRAQSEGAGPAMPQQPEAPLGTAFTYQGRLQDGSQPANGSYDFRFILYSANTGVSQVGPTLEAGDQPVSQGIFTVVLDFGNVFSGQALWLEVAVRPGDSIGAYTILSPRQALTPAPYAAYSQQVNAVNHNHLGQTWTGSNPLKITGSFSSPGYAPLVLSNTGGSKSDSGLRVNSTSGSGVVVASAGNIGVSVGSVGEDGVFVNLAGSPSAINLSTFHNGFEVAGAQGNGLFVGQADMNGVHVWSAGSPSTYVSTRYAKNGFEVAGAQGDGLFVGRADLDGVVVASAGNYGVYVSSAGSNGMFVSSAGHFGVFADTARADHNYGFYTPDNIHAANLSGTSFTLIAQVAGSGSLLPGDLAAAAGLGEALPDSSDPLPLVQLADATYNGVVGVVESRMVLVPHPQSEEESSEPLLELLSADGPAQPGDYVALRVMGPAQVKVDASAGTIQPGQRLTVSSVAGATRSLETRTLDGMSVTEGAPVIGTALSGPDENGMVWVLVNPQ